MAEASCRRIQAAWTTPMALVPTAAARSPRSRRAIWPSSISTPSSLRMTSSSIWSSAGAAITFSWAATILSTWPSPIPSASSAVQRSAVTTRRRSSGATRRSCSRSGSLQRRVARVDPRRPRQAPVGMRASENSREDGMKLYGFWRSQATFRVRIALNLKGLKREDVFINLDHGDQHSAAYKALNPQAVLPTLFDGDAKLFQSFAILEYLEERYPKPPILPADPLARAWVRGFALINVADSHPLIVPRIRNYLTDVLKVDEAAKTAWIQHWLAAGLEAMERLLVEKKPT